MQKDADGSRIADLRDAITTMERRLYDREKELTELRPMRAGYDDMTDVHPYLPLAHLLLPGTPEAALVLS